jgi:sodium-dependent dicarboxylate transporter 2/3/5
MRTKIQNTFLALGFAIILTLFILTNLGMASKMVAMAGVAFVIITFWIFEVLPLGVTALIPVICYPMMGIMSTKKIAPIYMSSTLMLFMGGFLVAIGMQRWNLHKRIALEIISRFGSSPTRVIFGFMCACAFLSMWISNTATCVMMVSIGLALISSYEEIEGNTPETKIFAASLMMAIAYACTIGGMATLVGTPPNLAFARIYEISFPLRSEISFGQWISFGLPIAIISVIFAGFAITFVMFRGKNIKSIDADIIKKEKASLGKISYEEKCVAVTFFAMAMMWIFRKDLNLGFTIVPGWVNLFPNSKYFDDGAIAVMMAIILFIIPTKNNKEYKTILDNSVIKKVPWDTILLFGGGFALAKGIQTSGLSDFLGSKFQALSTVSESMIIVAVTTGMAFITEITSNMASTETILPILVSISKETGISPVVLMIPTTLASSCAFMLPAATAPNAIIFGSGKIKIKDMIRVGFFINCFCIVLISIISIFLLPHIVQ